MGHTCFDSFYAMYESLCECLEAMLDPSSYPQLGAITLGAADLESVVIGLMFWEPDLPFSCSLRPEGKEWQRYWSSKEPN